LNRNVNAIQNLNFAIDDLGSDGSENLFGDSNNNRLFGLGGDDNLFGSLGEDFIDGGLGNDTVDYSSSQSILIRLGSIGQGGDAEGDTILGVENVNGSNFSDTIVGDQFTNIIRGLSGNDILDGQGSDDVLSGGEGDDMLSGGNGNDSLDGGSGVDTLIGGSGNDIYFVDSIDDITIELAGEGTDEVRSAISYTLGANVENLRFEGNASLSGSGNELANEITAGIGSASLMGLAGNDLLIGSNGNDILDGGTGIDTLIGRRGNDIYFVDNAGDVVTEAVNEGTDEVRATINYTLGANVENLRLIGAFSLTGTGNELANEITAGVGPTTLMGLGGNDTLIGGDGDDTLLGGDGNDIIRGFGGNDTLNGGAGFDELFGGDGDDQLTVTGGADIVAGETLDGGAGFDFVSVETIDGDVDFGLLSVSNVEGLNSLGSPNRLLITSAQLAQFERIGVAARIADSGAVTLHDADFSGSFLFLGDGVTSLDAGGIGAATDGLSIFGNGGTNILTGSNGSEGLSGGDGDDSIFGGDGRDGLRGEAGDDRLEGGMGDDGLDGGVGIDLLYGQDGNDILTPGTVSAVAGEVYDGGSGFDLLSLNGFGAVDGDIDISAATIVGIEAIDGGEFSFSSLSTTQFMAASQLTGRLALTDGGSVSLAGKTTLSIAGDVYGGALQVTLSSFGNSIDLAGSTPAIGINVFGGIGNDVIFGGSTGSQILAGGGNDRIVSRATSGLDNILGGDGDDIIDARLGRGGLNGEAGNDVLMVAENSGGSAISGGTGVDRLIVEGNFFTGSVFDGIEAVQLTTGATLALTVDQFRDGLSSTAAISGSGTIAIRSTSFAPQIVSAAALGLASGTQLTISITGESSGDQLNGHASAINILDGGSGSDQLFGGNRNDVLTGGFGSDILFGESGADSLEGGEGDDTLNGGTGVDTLTGGLGNDIFFVDNAGDVVTEAANEGTDEVRATINYTLGANIENLRLSGGNALIGTGNALANEITAGVGPATLSGLAGNDTLFGSQAGDSLDGGDDNDTLFGRGGEDVLSGGNGNDVINGQDQGDTLSGGAGDDTLRGDSGNDIVNGDVGNDRLEGGANNDTLNGGDGNDVLLGGDSNDTLNGGIGNDLVEGGTGRDLLTGGDGLDRFRFDDGHFAGLTGSDSDRILDFAQAQGDRIDLSLVDAVTGGADNAFTFIGTGAFTGVAGQLRFAQSGSFTLVSGDTNGDGTADFAIRVDGLINLVAADFVL
jgi:Ca2+-binding RTX toxin-like protein